MVNAFRIILLVVIAISFMGVVGEKDESLQEKLVVTFLGGLAAFIVSILWL